MAENDGRIVEPPEDIDTKTIVERTASFVSQFADLEIESDTMVNDARFNFLRSEADPCHAYYKYMLTKYSAAAGGSSDTAVNVASGDHIKDLTISDTGPEVRSITLAERVAYRVSIEGSGLETKVRDAQANDPRFNFLRDSSDEYHAYYQHRLVCYSIENKSQRKYTPRSGDGNPVEAQLVTLIPPTQILSLPNLLQFRLPQGMTLKELDTIKVTAQFSLWYGHFFVWALGNHVTELEFLNEKHSWNAFYNECKDAYEKVLKPPKDTRERLYMSADYTGAVQQGFIQRIQQDDPVKERKWLEQGDRAMIDWHDSVSKPFAVQEVPDQLPPQGPDAKRQKLDDSVLVPEHQFLAQHPCVASIKVSFPNGQGGTFKMMLSSKVFMLKLEIGELIGITPVKCKLSGKSGVLEDDKSLAHYNVGPGDILTLSL